MSSKHRFHKCDHCGNIAVLVLDKGVPIVCCGQSMSDLVPNTVEAATEKHLPSITVAVNDLSVQVGSVPHPMDEGHHISFVYVQSEQGGQRKCLKPGAEPKCEFKFIDDKPVAVFAYCNLHGLWETVI